MQPISYNDAYQILRNLTGTCLTGTDLTFPSNWVNGFSPDAKNPDPAYPQFTQCIGLLSTADNKTNPSTYTPLEVSLSLSMTFVKRPITDVCLIIPGVVNDDKWIILGNHRDAWVYGGVDPHQGTAALMELARVFGVMTAKGWQPRRRLVLCSWDGEEQALLGSTEWVEEHMQRVDDFPLRRSGVAYINVDVAITGDSYAILGVGASPSLGDFALNVSQSIPDPWQLAKSVNQSLYTSWANALDKGRTPEVTELGSGSDFTPFMQFAGIASLSLEFSGRG